MGVCGREKDCLIDRQILSWRREMKGKEGEGLRKGREGGEGCQKTIRSAKERGERKCGRNEWQGFGVSKG